MTAPPDLREYDEKIGQVRREKEAAIDAQDFEKAAALRDGERHSSPSERSASVNGAAAAWTPCPMSTRSSLLRLSAS